MDTGGIDLVDGRGEVSVAASPNVPVAKGVPTALMSGMLPMKSGQGSPFRSGKRHLPFRRSAPKGHCNEQTSDSYDGRTAYRVGHAGFSVHDAPSYKSSGFSVSTQQFRQSCMQPGLQADQRAFLQLLISQSRFQDLARRPACVLAGRPRTTQVQHAAASFHTLCSHDNILISFIQARVLTATASGPRVGRSVNWI
jgi:hypothetical protein